MGQNDHLPDDRDFKDFLSVLVSGEHLEGTPLGITKLVIDKGIGVLTPKQLYVFNEQVINQYTRGGCSYCEIEIPWSEMVHSLVTGGLCNHCWNMSENAKS